MKAAAPRVRRVNITLDEKTLGLIDRVAPRAGLNRSRFLEEAARYFARSLGRGNLKKLLAEQGVARRARDLSLVEEWAAVDAETWPDDPQRG
jgi:hypothetical protein